MEWQGSVRGVDEPLMRLYRGGMVLLYTRPAQVFLAAISLTGIVAFVLGVGELGTTLREPGAGVLAGALLYPAYWAYLSEIWK
jgi:hypothetical protein